MALALAACTARFLKQLQLEPYVARFDLGINYIDTSPLYKESEERLGRVFQALGGKPDNLFLSTKMGTHPARRGDYSAEATRWSVENSLRLLQVDYVELPARPRSRIASPVAASPGTWRRL